mgnify:CR=1 FL=1
MEPLKNSDVFPEMVTSMIGVGESTGALDAMLQKIAEFYEDEVDTAVNSMKQLIEPLMIVMLGLGVGFLLGLGVIIHGMLKGERVGPNPWHSLTLEWKAASPPPHENFHDQPVVTAGPYEYR